jgi:hypothetical protein
MTPGRFLYLTFHQPRERAETALDTFLLRGRERAMRAAACQLKPIASPPARALPPVRFLTGERFAHQTAFCAHSFCRAAGFTPRFEFFDDGTLRQNDAAMLRDLFPGAVIVLAQESGAAVERCLPTENFPSLRHARRCSPLMRKLLDLRVGRAGPALYLDSDMLFFSRPTALIEWLERNSGALHMTEARAGAYADDTATLAHDLGVSLPSGVNTGIVALDDARIDWPSLERAATALGSQRREHKWAEQTLTACLLAQLRSQPLDRDCYRVCASRADLRGPTPALRHYVHKAKMPYLAGEWRRFVS